LERPPFSEEEEEEEEESVLLLRAEAASPSLPLPPPPMLPLLRRAPLLSEAWKDVRRTFSPSGGPSSTHEEEEEDDDDEALLFLSAAAADDVDELALSVSPLLLLPPSAGCFDGVARHKVVCRRCAGRGSPTERAGVLRGAVGMVATAAEALVGVVDALLFFLRLRGRKRGKFGE